MLLNLNGTFGVTFSVHRLKTTLKGFPRQTVPTFPFHFLSTNLFCYCLKLICSKFVKSVNNDLSLL